ncbi:MAG: ABC transporter permease [Clostridiales bacterium]|jgi:nickel transport system permease protein|nr:ABC transporter permease [Clostridiales bacterium]
MRDYIIKRLLFLIPMFFIVSFCAFVLINASAKEPAMIILEAQGVPTITQELINETNAKYGFDRPFMVRYLDWLENAVKFEFGNSFVTKKDVSKTILTAFVYTLQLAIATTVTTIVFSLILGVFCVIWEGRKFDKITRAFMFVISAMPSYWIGTLSVWLFSVKLTWLPTSGVGSLKNFILPTLVMSISYCGFYFRMIRNSMLENTNENYVYFCRSCGVGEKKIIKHILRNSLQTVISAFSMAIPGMVAGTVVIENVFAWPGLGRLCVSAIYSRDIPIIQAYVLLLALFYCTFNILADIINAAVNPKLRKA